jgi:hypothetical protein
VLHRCDNPSCVNPDHLFLGSRRDNWMDMLRKGRYARRPKCQLSAEQIEKIRGEYIPRVVTERQLAQRYGVSHTAIHLVLSGQTYKNVATTPPGRGREGK